MYIFFNVLFIYIIFLFIFIVCCLSTCIITAEIRNNLTYINKLNHMEGLIIRKEYLLLSITLNKFFRKMKVR